MLRLDLTIQKPCSPVALAAYSVVVGLLTVGFLARGAGAQQSDSSFYKPRADWSSFSGGSLNISSFIFRDLNRNGTYDIGDRPMADIVVEMRRPNRHSVFRESNVHGFANFLMSVLNRDAAITEAGTYRFEVHVPAGWEVTTGNVIQSGEFQVFPGSYADIILKQPLSPVGLVQSLKIEGRVSADRAAKPTDVALVRVESISPTGLVETVPLDSRGLFSIPASAGIWRIRINHQSSGEKINRTITVDQAPVRLSTTVLGSDSPQMALIRTATDFDTITLEDVAEIPSGIGGLAWSNMVVADHTYYGGGGYVNTLISGRYVCYNSSGHPAAVQRSKPFDFYGGYFGVGWARAEGETLIVRGWRGETLVYEDEIELSRIGPVWFDADYRAVTRVDFSTRHYWQFVCDNLFFGL